MPRPENPSDTLAQLASAVHRLERSGERKAVEKWLKSALSGEAAIGEEREWSLSPEELFAGPAFAGLAWPVSTPASESEFVRVARAVFALDRWHRPLVPSLSGPYPKLRAHEEAIDRLQFFDLFGECDDGIILPGRAWAHEHLKFDREYASDLRAALKNNPLGGAVNQEAPTTVLPLLMFDTTYLPKVLQAQDQDGVAGSRLVTVRYKRVLGGAGAAFTAKGLIVAVAPLMEAKNDAEVCRVGRCYGVMPQYPVTRLQEVLNAAVAANVDILLLPETSVAADALPSLSAAIKEACRRHFEATSAPANLRYVFAGVSGPAAAAGGRAQNFVVILDSEGRELARQAKLFRWDLNGDQINRLGLFVDFKMRRRARPSTKMEENIAPADEVVLLDFDDLGRLLNFICADMFSNLPNDWFYQQCRLDWVHAPIFDQHIPPLPTWNWINDRAYRAAMAGRARVMVSNSISLTCRLNEQNASAPKERSYPTLSECGVGLFIDGGLPAPKYGRLTATVAAPSPKVLMSIWNHKWSALPKRSVTSLSASPLKARKPARKRKRARGPGVPRKR